MYFNYGETTGNLINEPLDSQRTARFGLRSFSNLPVSSSVYTAESHCRTSTKRFVKPLHCVDFVSDLVFRTFVIRQQAQNDEPRIIGPYLKTIKL